MKIYTVIQKQAALFSATAPVYLGQSCYKFCTIENRRNTLQRRYNVSLCYVSTLPGRLGTLKTTQNSLQLSAVRSVKPAVIKTTFNETNLSQTCCVPADELLTVISGKKVRQQVRNKFI